MAAPLFRKFCCNTQKVFRFCSTNVQKTAEEPVKKVKEPIRKRIKDNIVRMYEDYKFACRETVNLVKEKPLRMSVYATLVTSAGYLFSTNPSMKDYEAHLADMTCDLAEVDEDLRNPEKNAQIQSLIKLNTEGRLRRFTLGVCSFIWYTDYPAYVDLYESQCSLVKMRWRDWPQYIVDIGFQNQWLWSEQYIIDFDINPEEWKHLEQAVTNPDQLKQKEAAS